MPPTLPAEGVDTGERSATHFDSRHSFRQHFIASLLAFAEEEEVISGGNVPSRAGSNAFLPEEEAIIVPTSTGNDQRGWDPRQRQCRCAIAGERRFGGEVLRLGVGTTMLPTLSSRSLAVGAGFCFICFASSVIPHLCLDTPSAEEGLLAPSTAKVLFTPSLGLACWAETWLATMLVRYRRAGLVGLRFWLG